ncbi:hypothetical protein [Streptomyces rishiriensis]|uniref:hypothetical protein n=1 Tax=Streptomyces rishiriensis TaxID=68264 RepID=UPI0027D875DB|nr:hypothetical protein [Streptomyces rishiriensis]
MEQAERKERVGMLVGLPRPVGGECREQRSGIEGVVGSALLTQGRAAAVAFAGRQASRRSGRPATARVPSRAA